jgi:hypothetical protein
MAEDANLAAPHFQRVIESFDDTDEPNESIEPKLKREWSLFH